MVCEQETPREGQLHSCTLRCLGHVFSTGSMASRAGIYAVFVNDTRVLERSRHISMCLPHAVVFVCTPFSTLCLAHRTQERATALIGHFTVQLPRMRCAVLLPRPAEHARTSLLYWVHFCEEEVASKVATREVFAHLLGLTLCVVRYDMIRYDKMLKDEQYFRDWYRPHNQRLFQLLGREMPWK